MKIFFSSSKKFWQCCLYFELSSGYLNCVTHIHVLDEFLLYCCQTKEHNFCFCCMCIDDQHIWPGPYVLPKILRFWIVCWILVFTEAILEVSCNLQFLRSFYAPDVCLRVLSASSGALVGSRPADWVPPLCVSTLSQIVFKFGFLILNHYLVLNNLRLVVRNPMCQRAGWVTSIIMAL